MDSETVSTPSQTVSTPSESVDAPSQTIYTPSETAHMDSTQTLHDFVLNLLTDPDARSAFALDPEGALHSAGLGDVTLADVHDVVPLVADYAPLQNITSLAPVEPLGLGALDSDPSAVIGQLQAVAQQFTAGAMSSNADVNVATLGAVTIGSTGLEVGSPALSAIGGLGVGAWASPGVGVTADGSGAGADLSSVHDVSATLDSTDLGSIAHDPTGVVGTGSDLVGTVHGVLGASGADGILDTADFATGTVSSTLDSATHLPGSLDVTGLGQGAVAGVNIPTGGIDVHSTASGVTSDVGGTLHGVSGGVGGLTGDLGLHSQATTADAHTDAHASADGGLFGLH
jgi:hypothetical protein